MNHNAITYGLAAFAFGFAVLTGLVVEAADSGAITRTYEITRNGGKIGTMVHKIRREANTITFESDTNIDIEKVDITLYHRTNKFRSIWHGNEIESFSSDTDAQGKTTRVEGIRHSDALTVKRPDGTDTAPAGALPDTFWNIATVSAKHLINKTSGDIESVDISRVQPAEVTVGGKKIQAKHFLMTGDKNQSLFYADDNVWIGTSFHHSDGGLIEIILQ